MKRKTQQQQIVEFSKKQRKQQIVEFSKKQQNNATSFLTRSQPNIVRRFFYDDKMQKHRRQKRFTVICYEYNRKTQELKYAACLYKEDRENEMQKVFKNKKNLKAAIRETAMRRLEEKPVIIVNFYEQTQKEVKEGRKFSLKKFNERVRKLVSKCGAYSKHVCEKTH